MALFVTVASGFTVSSAFALPRGAERAFSVACPSNGVACGVNVGFATSSGTAPWFTLQQWNVGGNVLIHSGGGNAVGIVLTPPTPWARIELSAAPAATMSYQIAEIANR